MSYCAIWQFAQNCQRCTQLCPGPFRYFLHAAVGIGAMNKFGSCCHWPYEHRPRMLLVSVATSAMNHPWLWELSKECLTDIGNCKECLTNIRIFPKIVIRAWGHWDIGTSTNTLAALQREWGSSVKPWKRPTDENAAYPYGAMNFHSRTGNLFPNSQQLHKMAL
jgi:hypothetical protein